MSNTNPYFSREERSPYELGSLLRELPGSIDIVTTSITDEQHDQMLAADRHAANYTSTLLNGLESMGRALRCAASNTRVPISLDDVAQMGSLISVLAIQLEFLDDFRTAAAARNLHTAFQAGKAGQK